MRQCPGQKRERERKRTSRLQSYCGRSWEARWEVTDFPMTLGAQTFLIRKVKSSKTGSTVMAARRKELSLFLIF